MPKKQGAGIIPFTIYNGNVYFLFHKTFKGRRSGLLVDFGGGSEQGESYQQTAIREFIEETESMFFAENIAVTNEHKHYQFELLEKLLQQTQQQNPGWWCSRRNLKNQQLKNWQTYFVKIDYKDLTSMNDAWAADNANRFVKRRELLWVRADKLLAIIENEPEKLWKRVRELDNLKSIVLSISTRAVTVSLLE